MQQHIAGTGRIRTCQIADDGVEAEHGLDRIGLEPFVENVASRSPDEIECRPEAVVLPQPPANTGKLCQCTRQPKPAQRQIGWRIKHEAAQHTGDAADLRLIIGIAGRVLGAELCDLALGAALACQ